MRLLHRATDVSIRKYAEICGKLRKIYGDLQQNTETRRIPVGQISYSSIGGVSLFNGIAQWRPKEIEKTRNLLYSAHNFASPVSFGM